MAPPAAFATNMLMIICGLFVLAFLFVCIMSTWTGIRVLAFLRRQRRSEAMWKKVSRRADGKPYPSQMEGVCGSCGRGGRFIFFPQDSEKALCAVCYEPFWRQAEGYVEPMNTDTVVEPQAHHC